MADDAEQNGSKTPANGEPSLAKAKTDSKPWRPWTIAVAALAALLVSLLLIVGDALAGVLNNMGGPASATRFLQIAALGHGALALLSAVLFAVGMANAARRRPAALAALAIIPVGIGWFFLLGRLAAIA